MEPEQSLLDTIAFALGQYRYAPPRTKDVSAIEAYHRSVADAVVRQIKLSWEIAPGSVLAKKPPKEHHSIACHSPEEMARWEEETRKALEARKG